MKVKVAQSCTTLCNSMDCSLPGVSVHVILQARILEWIVIPFSKESLQPRDQVKVSHIAGGFSNIHIYKDEYGWRCSFPFLILWLLQHKHLYVSWLTNFILFILSLFFNSIINYYQFCLNHCLVCFYEWNGDKEECDNNNLDNVHMGQI